MYGQKMFQNTEVNIQRKKEISRKKIILEWYFFLFHFVYTYNCKIRGPFNFCMQAGIVTHIWRGQCNCLLLTKICLIIMAFAMFSKKPVWVSFALIFVDWKEICNAISHSKKRNNSWAVAQSPHFFNHWELKKTTAMKIIGKCLRIQIPKKA